MRDKKTAPLNLRGEFVALAEIQPEYFSCVVAWRNDENLNRYLNQPEKLTLESEKNWYEKKYLADPTQGFLIMLDNKSGEPFATLGWTDFDAENRRAIMGRLLLGNSAYGNSPAFVEGFFLLGEYLYKFVDVLYIHVGNENKSAIRLNKRLGFRENAGQIQYPHELFVNGDKLRPQTEFFRTKEMFYQVKKKLFDDIRDELLS